MPTTDETLEAAHRLAITLSESYPFEADCLVVDLSGSAAHLLVPLLEAEPWTRGVLLELPAGLETAALALQQAGLPARCRIVLGSFFDAVPAGGDVYLLKDVLPDWDDAACARILGQAARAMAPDTRLLLIQRLAPGGGGRRQRTAGEHEALLADAGLVIRGALPLVDGYSALVARRA